MAEYIAIASQTVAANQNVLFPTTTICGGGSIMHRTGSGLVTLRGITKQCRARFKVSFSGNIAIPAGGTVGPISLSIAIDGEPDVSTTMITTPAAVNEFDNISGFTHIDVPVGCCMDVTIQNTSTQSILVQNANLLVERVA